MIPKPQLHKREDSYDWTEIHQYIRDKYGREVRDWASRFHPKVQPEAEYQDFWHHMIDRYDIHNGATITISPAEMLEQTYESAGLLPWQKEIYQILRDEFGDEFMVQTTW